MKLQKKSQLHVIRVIHVLLKSVTRAIHATHALPRHAIHVLPKPVTRATHVLPRHATHVIHVLPKLVTRATHVLPKLVTHATLVIHALQKKPVTRVILATHARQKIPATLALQMPATRVIPATLVLPSQSELLTLFVLPAQFSTSPLLLQWQEKANNFGMTLP